MNASPINSNHLKCPKKYVTSTYKIANKEKRDAYYCCATKCIVRNAARETIKYFIIPLYSFLPSSRLHIVIKLTASRLLELNASLNPCAVVAKNASMHVQIKKKTIKRLIISDATRLHICFQPVRSVLKKSRLHPPCSIQKTLANDHHHHLVSWKKGSKFNQVANVENFFFFLRLCVCIIKFILPYADIIHTYTCVEG